MLQTFHGPMHFTSKPVEKPCFVAASHAHAKFLKNQLDFECRVVHHGIPLEKYSYQGKKGDYLLYLARVSEEKGALEFVRLCKATGMKGMLVGPDDSVADPIAYPRMVMEACSATNGLVQYYGPAGNNEEKVELLQNARCLVSPLKAPYIEIFGMALVEAMACGTPVLATDQGAPRELVVHGITGAIARDFTCLEEGLKIALECEPAACRKRAEEFPRETMATGYLDLYRRMMEEGVAW